MGLGALSMLGAAWTMGGSIVTDSVWKWMIVLSIYVALTASLQDLRDRDGDKLIGRRTTSLILGDTLGAYLLFSRTC